MFRSTVTPDGSLQLGAAAELAGYQPGQLVNVLVTRAGSLIVSFADDSDTIDLSPVKPIPKIGHSRPAIASGMAAPDR